MSIITTLASAVGLFVYGISIPASNETEKKPKRFLAVVILLGLCLGVSLLMKYAWDSQLGWYLTSSVYWGMLLYLSYSSQKRYKSKESKIYYVAIIFATVYHFVAVTPTLFVK